MNWKKKFVNSFRIIFSLILIGYLIWLAGSTQILKTLAGSNLFYIALVIFPANLDRMLMAWKWNMLLRVKGIHVPLWTVISAYYKTSFWGNLFLPTIGADALRMYEISRQTKRTDDIISSIVIERGIGILATVMVGSVGLTWFILEFSQDGLQNLLKIFGLLVVFSILFAVSLKFQWLDWLTRFVPVSKLPLMDRFKRIYVSYQDYAAYKGVLAIFLFFTIIEQLIPVFSSYLVAKAFHLDIPFDYFLMFVPLILMIIRLPISFDGIGVREGLYVYFFGLVGVPASAAFLVGFVKSILGRILISPLTLYFFLSSRSEPAAVEVDAQPLPAEK